MTTVNVGATVTDPTHDLSLQDGTDAQVTAGTATRIGLIFAGGPKVLQEIPLTPPAKAFETEQKNWIGGRGKLRYDEDPTGYLDDYFLWSTTEGKLLPSLQWRFGASLRSVNTSMPADNNNLAWWKLYGSAPASKNTRYLDVRFPAAGNYNADKGYLVIKRVGTPGTLTFELCADDGSNNPSTVHKTVTKTITSAGLIEGVGVFLVFDWTTTQALVSGTTYHLKVYGDSSDNSASHWEVLTDDDGTLSKYSTDNSAWTNAGVQMYYRVTDADTDRQWRYFFHEGVLYAVSQNDAGGASVLMRNGEAGTATAGTSTTLTCSALSMTTDEYAAVAGVRKAALIRIYDGTGDGQVRTITANTATQFTVSPAWAVTPDTTSRFIVYSTDRWTVIAGHGLTTLSGKPVSTGTVCYFPQGGTAIRRMRFTANTYDFAADGSNTASLLKTHIEGSTLKVVAANPGASTVKISPAPAWGVNLAFGVAKAVATSDYRINNLYSHNKVLYIFKEDGLYTYNNGIVERVGSNFADIPDRFTGVGVGSQDQYLWFGWAHSIIKLLGNSATDMLNYKRGTNGMPDDRVGSVSDIVSAVGWLFFIIDGGNANYSSIVVQNGNGFHEIFRSWAPGVRIRNAIWQPCLEGRARLWFDIGGDIAYIEFPQYAANPLNDSDSSPKAHGVNYHWTGVCITSNYDAHDPNLYKILQTLRVFVDSGSAEVDYKLNDPTGSSNNTGWTNINTVSTSPVTELDLNLGEAFVVRFRIRFNVTNTRTAPVLSGWQLKGRMIQPDLYQYLGTFKTESDGTTHSDEPDHDPNTLFAQILSWARTQKKLTMRTQNASSDQKVVTVSLPSKSVDWIDTQENKWGGRISTAILES